jgi:chemotaxis protein MotB
MEALTDTFELKRERFSVVGRAETSPVDSNETPAGRSRNRRVDVIIVNSLKLKAAAPAIAAAIAKPAAAK